MSTVNPFGKRYMNFQFTILTKIPPSDLLEIGPETVKLTFILPMNVSIPKYSWLFHQNCALFRLWEHCYVQTKRCNSMLGIKIIKLVFKICKCELVFTLLKNGRFASFNLIWQALFPHAWQKMCAFVLLNVFIFFGVN